MSLKAAKKAPSAAVPALGKELALLEELMMEQLPGAEKRAAADPGKLSATYIAKENHMALLIVRAEKPETTRRLYLCQIVEVKDVEVGS